MWLKTFGRGRVYRHFKGGLYEFVSYGYLEADMSKVVIYRSVKKDDRVFVRSKASWEAVVEWPDKVKRPRFSKVH